MREFEVSESLEADDPEASFSVLEGAVTFARSRQLRVMLVESQANGRNQTWEVWPDNSSPYSEDELAAVGADLLWKPKDSKTTVTSVFVAPGRYFLGDPCYAVPEDGWGSLTRSMTPTNGVGWVDGHPVLHFGTYWGDGLYEDQEGHTYSVDAGLIGLTPEVVGWKRDIDSLESLGRVVTFEFEEIAIRYGTGLLRFGPYYIETK